MGRGEAVSMYGGDIKKLRASIDIKKAKSAEGMEIGEPVTITITGKVRSIDSPREDVDYRPGGSKTVMRPGCIELEITGMKVGDKDVGVEGDEE